MGLLAVAMEDKKKKVKLELQKQMPLGGSISDIDKLVNKQFNNTITTLVGTGVPVVISGEALKAVFNSNGLYGDKRLLRYFNNNIEEICSNAKAQGTIDDSDIAGAKKIFSQISNAESFKNLLKPQHTPYEKFAIAIVKKSAELGVNPADVLSDSKYLAAKKSAIVEGYGSMDDYIKAQKAVESFVPYVQSFITQIETGKLKPENVYRLLEKLRPKQGILKEAWSKLTSKMLSDTILLQTEDYLRLTKGLMEYTIAESNAEIKAYQ